MATYLGVIEEDRINNMSWVFFDDVLSEQGKRQNYEAVVNYAGNSFCEKSWEMIQDAHPFTNQKAKGENAFAKFVNDLVR